MSKYTARLTAPAKTDRHYYSNDNAFFRSGFGMPNCTAYAHGRFAEITGKFPKMYGNAEDWWDEAKKAGYETGPVPKLGAICVWRAGQTHNSADGAGHVAIVEQIKANGDIVTSNSAWKGLEFYTQEITKVSGYMYASNRPFLGFIYCGVEFESDPTPASGTVMAGKTVALNNIACYSSESAKTSYGAKTGTFYLWDDAVKNGRIRITNSPSRVGVAGQVTCWINVADVGLSTSPAQQQETAIKAGTSYTLTDAPVYSSESGVAIGKRSGTYYTWDSVIKNGRIRMTNSASRVGIPGQVSFWTDVKSLK